MARNSLREAVLQSNVLTVKLILNQGANVNAFDHLRRTPLHLAVLKPNTDIVKLLLEHGANVNALAHLRKTPLHFAALTPHVDIVKLLLEHGASVNAADKLGQTPLHCAVLKPHVKIAEILLNCGANVNALDKLGRTPLHFIVPKPHVNVAKVLLEHGANVNALDMYHRTPLHQYKWAPHADIVKFLFEHGANINALDCYYQTPLHYAIRNGFVNTVKLLLQHGANVNPVNIREEPVLHHATVAPNLEIVKLLLEHGANVNALSDLLLTPLNIFAHLHCVSIIRLLLDYGANVNYRYELGDSPLRHSVLAANNLIKESSHILSKSECSVVMAYETIKLLLENGAIPDFENEANILVDTVNSKDYFAELLIQYIILRISVSHGIFEVFNRFKSVLRLAFAEDSYYYKHFLRIAHLCINDIKNMRNDYISKQTLFQFVSNNYLRTVAYKHSVSLYDIDALLILLRNGKYVVCRDLIDAVIKRSVMVDRLCELEICYQTAECDTVTLDYDCIYNLNKYMSKDDVINLILSFCDEFSDHECPGKGVSKTSAEKNNRNV